MLHESVTFGYDWDDETETLIAREQIKDYGMFSTYTLMMSSIVGVYKKYNKIVKKFDYKHLMKKFKWEEDVDMYQHFFTFNNDHR